MGPAGHDFGRTGFYVCSPIVMSGRALAGRHRAFSF
jgi:hypothetical protein